MDFLLSSAKELVANGAAKLNRTINQAIPTLGNYEIDATFRPSRERWQNLSR